MALSKEVNIKNQMCISSAMLIFHKYILTHQFSLPLELANKNKSLYNYLDLALSDVNEAFSCLVSEVEITYLSAFFLATKISNCLTSITKLIQYYVNTSDPIVNYLSNELAKEHNKILKEYKEQLNKQNQISSGYDNIKINNTCNLGNQNNNNTFNYGTKSKQGINKFQLGHLNNFSMGNLNANSSSNFPISQNNNQSSQNNSINNLINLNNLNNLNNFYCHHNNQTNANANNNTQLQLKEHTSQIGASKSLLYHNPTHNNISQMSMKEPSDFIKQHLDTRIKLREMEILERLGFDINLDLPYIYVEKMKPYIVQYIPKSEKFIGIINNFINDSFKIPVCLFYSPLKIALSAVYLLSVHFNIELLCTKDGTKWYQLIDPETSLEEVVEIAELINLIYQLPSKTSKRKSSVEALRELIHVNVNASQKVKDHGEQADFQVFSFLNKKRQPGVLSVVELSDGLFPSNSISNNKSNCEADDYQYQESTFNTETSSEKDFNMEKDMGKDKDKEIKDTDGIVKSLKTIKQVDLNLNIEKMSFILNEIHPTSSQISIPPNKINASSNDFGLNFLNESEISSNFK